jgi:hypothetical protein
MNYLDEFGLSDDDIKAIDEGIEEANKFFAKVSSKEFFTGESLSPLLLPAGISSKESVLVTLDLSSIK